MDTETRTRRFVRWLKDKIEKRQSDRDDHDPWWVTLMLDVGRPAVAIMILTMCAPGEHYLGIMAGFASLAWLTPASLTAYAGISAVVATKRPKGAPGRKTAVAGAILSILLAMAAQPVAHLYEQQLITGHRFALTIVVSVIPAAVFGHLLHMGAATAKQRRTPRADRKPDRKPDSRTAGRRILAATLGQSLDVPADTLTVQPDTGSVTVDRTPDIGTGSLSADVRKYLTDNPDASNDDLYEAMRTLHPGKPDNTFYVARKRHEKKIGRTA